jgi:hypothetical protein
MTSIVTNQLKAGTVKPAETLLLKNGYVNKFVIR